MFAQPIFEPAVIVAKPLTAVSMRTKRVLISMHVQLGVSFAPALCAGTDNSAPLVVVGVYYIESTNEDAVLTVLPKSGTFHMSKAPDFARLWGRQAVKRPFAPLPRWISFQRDAI